jgi:hypothetical protein
MRWRSNLAMKTRCQRISLGKLRAVDASSRSNCVHMLLTITGYLLTVVPSSQSPETHVAVTITWPN